MPTFTKRGQHWRAEIRHKGSTKEQRASKTFTTLARAKAWAAQIEAEIAAGRAGEVPDKTVAALLERYRDEVSPTKKGERWETVRIGQLLRDEIAQVKLRDLSETHVASWRDRRLQGTPDTRAVAPGSVLREWTLLSAAFSTALREWKWLRYHPMKAVKRPKAPQARQAFYSHDQIERLGAALGEDPATATGRTGLAFRFAIETAMRAGEIVGLTWDRVDIERRYCSTAGKTPAARRQVPLSTEALRVLGMLPRTERPCFDIDSASLDTLFRKGKDRAMIEGLTFHDARATAIMRLSKKLDILDLARAVGHKDLKMLMIYYRATASEIAEKLR